VTQEHFHNDLVPLSSAAATAYLTLARVAGAPRALPENLRDVAAIALAACIPIYGAREAHEPLRQLSHKDLAGGRFAQGAARLHFNDRRPPFTRLAVTAADFVEGLMRLKRAGVNFSEVRAEPARRRVPTVMPVLA
jgi:hypothetical protein